MVETVGMVLDRIERKAGMAVELPPNATSLDLLRAIYRNPHAELTMRIRCAMACLQFEHAKLGVTVQVSEQGFAELLDRRLKKLAAMENGSKAVAIDGPRPQIDARPSLAPTNDRRFRRM